MPVFIRRLTKEEVKEQENLPAETKLDPDYFLKLLFFYFMIKIYITDFFI